MLEIMLYIGIALGLVSLVNITLQTITNISNGEKFSFKKLFKGIGKVILLWVLSTILVNVCDFLPEINTKINETLGVTLIGTDALEGISAVAVLGIIISALLNQIRKAIGAIKTFFGENEEIIVLDRNE